MVKTSPESVMYAEGDWLRGAVSIGGFMAWGLAGGGATWKEGLPAPLFSLIPAAMGWGSLPMPCLPPGLFSLESANHGLEL